MKLITETGSQYIIADDMLTKKDKHGNSVDSFKIWSMKALPDYATTLIEALELPDSEPEIGKRLYVSGKDVWWISTKIVEIEYDTEEQETHQLYQKCPNCGDTRISGNDTTGWCANTDCAYTWEKK